MGASELSDEAGAAEPGGALSLRPLVAAPEVAASCSFHVKATLILLPLHSSINTLMWTDVGLKSHSLTHFYFKETTYE